MKIKKIDHIMLEVFNNRRKIFYEVNESSEINEQENIF